MHRVKRLVLVPYAVLAVIPTTFAGLGVWQFASGNPDRGRAWFFYSWTGYLCLPLSAALLAVTPPTLLFDPVKRRPLEMIQRVWGKLSLLPFFDRDSIEIESVDHGLEELRELLDDKQVPVITLSNHNSWLDIYALFFLDVPLRFVSKKEIFYIPVVGWVMGLIGHMYLDRNDKNSRESLVDRSTKALQQGVPLIHFFPEGTRSRNGQLGEFKIGAFTTAVRANVPCIPIQILGTRDIMPETTILKSTNTAIRIRVFPPVHPNPSPQGHNDDEFTEASRLRDTCRENLLLHNSGNKNSS